MKKLMTLVIALLSVATFATDINENSTWEEIRAELKTDWDLSLSGYVSFLGRPVSSLDVCIEGENFKTTRKFPIYKFVRVPRHMDTDGDRDGRMWKKVGEKILTYPIVYTTQERVCRNRNRDSNCRYVTKIVEQDTVKNISIMKTVRRAGRDRDDVKKVLFKKEYVIPACN